MAYKHHPDLKPDIKYTKLFINNEWVDSLEGTTFKTINPCNLEEIAVVQEAGKADVDRAVKAAKEAFEIGSTWRKTGPTKRAALLRKLSQLIRRDMKYIATLESFDNGKPFFSSVGCVYGIIQQLEYYAGWADKITGETIPVDGDFLIYTRHEPVGVCGQIIPWNFPINMFISKFAPAIAAGCTVVMKPSELTPLTALYLAALVEEAGFPPGVLNVVNGPGTVTGQAITEHPDVNKVSFTGSTAVGKLIQQTAGKTNLKRVTLELGGKSPNIVLKDADLDQAAENAHIALFENMGQCCTAGSRTYVQEDIYDEFVKKAVEKAKKRKIGDPFDPKVKSGPQISEKQFQKILDLIESGKTEGAKLECGGGRHGDQGYYIQNTVFSDVQDHMRIAKEEIFGPVQQIIKFKTIDEVIKRANDTHYGLAAGVYTNDINKAVYISNQLQAGVVWVNCYHVVNPAAPFGGYKMSGIGRENGSYGLLPYLEIKTVVMKIKAKI